MKTERARKFSLKFFRVIWEPITSNRETTSELVPRVNRQISPATQRNRIKRVLREFFRKHCQTLGPGRWVFIGKPRAAHVPNSEVFCDLETLLKKIV